LAHLPIAIGTEFVERCFNVGPFEGTERDDNSTSDRRFPRGVAQDGSETSRVPKFAERGDRLFDDERISVGLRDANDLIEEFVAAVGSHDLQGGNDAEVVRIVKPALEFGAQLEGLICCPLLVEDVEACASHARIYVVERFDELVGCEPVGSGQPNDGTGANAGVGIDESAAQELHIIGVGSVPCGDDPGATFLGVAARYGIDIVTHDATSKTKPTSTARRVVRVALVSLVIVVFLGFVASRISTNDFAITPGGAQPVAPLITIQGKSSTSAGKILLTDVYLTPLSLLTYLPAWFSNTTDIVSQDALVDPGVSISELDAQGYLEMEQAKQSAKVAALTRLGYPVGSKPAGAVITAVGTDTPAEHKLAVADVIVGVNGTATTTSCQVIAATHNLLPGTTAELRVEPANISNDGSITYGKTTTVHVVLAAAPKGDPGTPCPGVVGPPKAYVGISLSDQVNYTFPFSIQISTPNIGGPSAGLAMTLGIMDQLSHGSLLHHQTIAATGTIDPTGKVGDVGGVRQKAVAVSNAHATLFFVPVVERSAAESTAAPSLKVNPVATLNQALNVLFADGGSITLANGTAQR
jgi:Lon-like protease